MLFPADFPSVRDTLRAGGVDRADWEARQILGVAQSRKDAEFMAWRRAAGEPLAYVLGEWDFYGQTFKVTRDVLIPRADTEILCEKAIGWTESGFRVLDLCSGSGCIGLSVAAHANCNVTLCDVSPAAMAVAEENCTGTLGVNRVIADALAPPPAGFGTFDLMVCNPPYISDDEFASLDDTVRDHEPHLALKGGADGLDFYRAVSAQWKTVLVPGGRLAFEIGCAQRAAVTEILCANGFSDVESFQDYAGHDRVVAGVFGVRDPLVRATPGTEQPKRTMDDGCMCDAPVDVTERDVPGIGTALVCGRCGKQCGFVF